MCVIAFPQHIIQRVHMSVCVCFYRTRTKKQSGQEKTQGIAGKRQWRFRLFQNNATLNLIIISMSLDHIILRKMRKIFTTKQECMWQIISVFTCFIIINVLKNSIY